MADFAAFDTRRYRTVSVETGYAEWAAHYEATVHDELDVRLFDRCTVVDWGSVATAADLACGSGRIGAWLRRAGVQAVDGVDATEEMLALAEGSAGYRRLLVGDVTATGLPGSAYDLVTQSLADEHLPELGPLYVEAARLATHDGAFVLAGYHPYFLMNGVPTHFHQGGTKAGEPVAIRSYVHQLGDHVRAAHAAGWTLAAMDEGVVDDAWLERKPQWSAHRGRPVSFLFAWRKRA